MQFGSFQLPPPVASDTAFGTLTVSIGGAPATVEKIAIDQVKSQKYFGNDNDEVVASYFWTDKAGNEGGHCDKTFTIKDVTPPPTPTDFGFAIEGEGNPV